MILVNSTRIFKKVSMVELLVIIHLNRAKEEQFFHFKEFLQIKFLNYRIRAYLYFLN